MWWLRRGFGRWALLVLAAAWAGACAPSTVSSPGNNASRVAKDPWAHLPSYAFIWPADGVVVSPFGRRDEGQHDGIDIRASEGRPIRAVLDGEVVYSGALPGYGKVVILRHRNSLSTVYAHNQSNLVPVGRLVRRGEVIARLGRTGRADEPNLHFEVRRRNEARDPLQYLPRRVGSAGPGKAVPPKSGG